MYASHGPQRPDRTLSKYRLVYDKQDENGTKQHQVMIYAIDGITAQRMALTSALWFDWNAFYIVQEELEW